MKRYLIEDDNAPEEALDEAYTTATEMVLEEALRLECLNLVADLVKQSAQLEACDSLAS